MAEEEKEERAEEVVAQVSDLEFVSGVLHNLYYLSIALDLQDQYRKLETRGATSALSAQAEEAVTKVDALLELANKGE
jgi:hypothetical protein